MSRRLVKRQPSEDFNRKGLVSFNPLPNFIPRVADASHSQRIALDFGSELEGLFDQIAGAFVSILHRLGILVPIESVGPAMVINGHASLRVGLGDDPVPASEKLEPTSGCRGLSNLPGLADENPGSDKVPREWNLFPGGAGLVLRI